MRFGKSATVAAIVAASFFSVLGTGGAHPLGRVPAVDADRLEYRFAFKGNVAEVPAESLCERLFVPVRVNQTRPALFEINTANPNSILYSASSGEDQPQAVGNSTVALLDIPGLEMRVTDLATGDTSNISKLVGAAVHGVLGADLLSRFILDIQYDRSSVIFHDANAFNYNGKGTVIPLVVRNGVPSVHAKINIPGHGTFEDEFDIQTGYNGSVAISHSYVVAHRMHMSHMKTLHFPESAGSSMLVTRAKNIIFGPYVVDNAIVEFPSEHSSITTPSAMIGNAILRKFRVILDVPHQRMILESNSTFPNDVEYDKSGVALIASGPNLKTFEVAGVAPHSPGSQAGLQTGDVIAGIDNQPAADLNLSEIQDMFREARDYRITVLRHDKTVDLKLKTHPIV
jgi:PDZ domain